MRHCARELRTRSLSVTSGKDFSQGRRRTNDGLTILNLRRMFVEGPVVILPKAKQYTFSTIGVTPLPGDGTVWPGFRATADWGELTAESVLITSDQSHIVLPAATHVEGPNLSGPGWTPHLVDGWTTHESPRPRYILIVEKRSDVYRPSKDHS